MLEVGLRRGECSSRMVQRWLESTWSLILNTGVWRLCAVELGFCGEELQSCKDRALCAQYFLVYALRQQSLASILGGCWRLHGLEYFQLQPGDHIRFSWLQEGHQCLRSPWILVKNERSVISSKYSLHNLRVLLNDISFEFTGHFNFELGKP